MLFDARDSGKRLRRKVRRRLEADDYDISMTRHGKILVTSCTHNYSNYTIYARFSLRFHGRSADCEVYAGLHATSAPKIYVSEIQRKKLQVF